MNGEVVYLYAFDVANEITTGRIQQILANESAPIQLRVDHAYPREASFYQALTIELTRPAHVQGTPVRIVVRVFEVGVVNISMRVPVAVESLDQLLPFHHPKLDDGTSFDEFAHRLCGEVCESIRDSLVRSSVPSEPEAYTVFCLKDLNGQGDVERWLVDQRRAVAALLTETPAESLSQAQVDESSRIARSYTTRDLVVIDWDASLIVDLDGYWDDVLYVLELANLQLEEFRVMDQRLDRHLDRAYRDMERSWSVWWGAPRGMLDWLRRFRVDVTKLADEVTHITKFVGDWHLARVYLSTQERFHLAHWQQSVQQRLAQLDEVYRVIQADVYERRMLWLEVAVVVCFVIDLVGLFLLRR